MTAEPQARTDWPLVLLIWGAGLGAAAQYGKMSVTFDMVPALYPEAGAWLGFTVSLVGFLGIALGVVAGVLVARLGYRRALLGALTAGAALSALQALTPPLWLFLLLRGFEGASHLAVVVAAPTLIAELAAPRDRPLALTLWGSFFGVAFTLLALLGRPLAASWGLPALLAAHAGWMALFAALLWRRLPPRRRDVPALPGLAELAAAHLRLYRSPRIGAPALGWLCYTGCFVSALTLLPLELDPGWRGPVLAAMPLLTIVVSLTLGVLALEGLPAVAVIVAGFAVAAVAAAGLAAAPGQPLLALLLASGLGLVQGATFAQVAELNAKAADRALANGGLAQMGNLGNTLGTPLMVLAVAAYGAPALGAGLAALLVAGAAVHLALAAARRRSGRSAPPRR